jgi:hypothetical protein
MRTSVGPAKNLPKKRKRNAQQNMKTQRSFAGIFLFLGKKDRLKLGGFTDDFLLK